MTWPAKIKRRKGVCRRLGFCRTPTARTIAATKNKGRGIGLLRASTCWPGFGNRRNRSFEGRRKMFQWINDNPYTCPLLMMVQGWVRWQKWHYGCSGWVLLSGPHSRATCKMPEWMIRLECRSWNSWIGCIVQRGCGTEQREYRLRQQQSAALKENGRWTENAGSCE